MDEPKRLEAALRRLPVVGPRTPGGLPYAATIPGIARELLMMGRCRPCAAAAASGGDRIDELIAAATRHREDAGSARTRKELGELRKHAEGLLGAINALHEPAMAALDYPLTGPAGLTPRLLALIEAASAAEVSDRPPARGRPKKGRAARIAARLAEEYHRLTEKAPTVIFDQDESKTYSPFIDLVAEVFGILGVVDASPASQGKAAAEGFKAKNHRKRPH